MLTPKTERFVPGKHCNYCARTRSEARKEPCPGPYRSRFWDGRHSWVEAQEEASDD